MSLARIDAEDRALWLATFKNQQRFFHVTQPQQARAFLENPKLVWEKNYPTMPQIIALFPEPMAEWMQDANGRWYQDSLSILTAHEAVSRFLRLQLSSYLLNTPQKTSPTQAQLEEMAMDLYAVMKSYTVPEIMLFFAMLRSGTWKMYNRGNIQEVLELFKHEFMEYRSHMIDQVAIDKRRIEREQEQRECISYEEALARGLVSPALQNMFDRLHTQQDETT